MARKKGTKSVLVVGLGRFGSSVASTLNEMEQDVLAVDKDPEIVARWSSQIPVVQADMTDVMAIERTTPRNPIPRWWRSATASRLP